MKINIGCGVSLNTRQVAESSVFQDWAQRLSPEWQGEVTINVAGVWGGEIHMLHMTVDRAGKPWAEQITLRSETVDILTIVTDGDQEWVVFVEQEREASSCRVLSNPAGGREWPESVGEASRRELWEELGLDDTNIEFEVQLSMLLPKPVLATPGITNERVYMMRARVKVAPGDLNAILQELRGKKAGVTAEGEELTLSVVPASKARDFIFAQQNPDAKTLLSLGYARL